MVVHAGLADHHHGPETTMRAPTDPQTDEDQHVKDVKERTGAK